MTRRRKPKSLSEPAGCALLVSWPESNARSAKSIEELLAAERGSDRSFVAVRTPACGPCSDARGPEPVQSLLSRLDKSPEYLSALLRASAASLSCCQARSEERR